METETLFQLTDGHAEMFSQSGENQETEAGTGTGAGMEEETRSGLSASKESEALKPSKEESSLETSTGQSQSPQETASSSVSEETGGNEESGKETERGSDGEEETEGETKEGGKEGGEGAGQDKEAENGFLPSPVNSDSSASGTLSPSGASNSQARRESPESSRILDTLDHFSYEGLGSESALDWQDNLAACRSSLASCVPLLLFGDIVLCLLLGCLCASIFSRFWKVNR